MQYRPLGNSGVTISEIGMGCNRLGEPQQPDEFWVSLVHRAIDLGVTLFDTCEAYGWGRSEEILGQAVGNRDDVLVADKISRVRETGEKDFSAKRVIQRVEVALKRLERDHIDLLQLHSPALEQLQQYDWPLAMQKLKEQGKIRLGGVSINDASSGEWLIEQGLVDAIQVPYSLIDQKVGPTIFPLALGAGVGTLVRVPMAQGILTGKFSPGQPVPQGHRAHQAGERMAERIAQTEPFRAVAAKAGLPMATLALRYAITPAGVSAAIPGARTIKQLEQNVSASNGVGLDSALIAELEAIQR